MIHAHLNGSCLSHGIHVRESWHTCSTLARNGGFWGDGRYMIHAHVNEPCLSSGTYVSESWHRDVKQLLEMGDIGAMKGTCYVCISISHL